MFPMLTFVEMMLFFKMTPLEFLHLTFVEKILG